MKNYETVPAKAKMIDRGPNNRDMVEPESECQMLV